nr:ATP-binding cassette domain-containing protein [Providencia sp. M-27]
MSDDYSIRLSNVEKTFAGLGAPAVESLTIDIHGGSVTGLVGPDGAGKTTLMRMIAGLLKPDAGKISVMGLDPIDDSIAMRADLGYMPQKFGLYEDLTVQENLNLYADLRGVLGEERQKTYQQLLSFTSLAPFTSRLAGKLSGGMKQKLGLACTLLGKPKVLLLDEPGVGVDPIARRELWQMVHTLADDGMLILWSTSYLDEAQQCKNVLLLNKGKQLYAGKPELLTEKMAGRSFLLDVPATQKRTVLQNALVLPETTDGVIQGRYVRLILKPNASQTNLLTALNMADGKLIEAQPRFEDAFIDLLGGGPSHRSELAAIVPQIPPAPEETVIEARNLTKKFGQFAATDRVNFQVKRGEIFGLLGPNGAGKSTTFKMMCALMKPTSGQALVLGMDLKTSSNKVRQQLGYMAQKFSLYGNLKVGQNLKFFSGVYGLHHQQQAKKIHEMVEAFNFKPIINQVTESLPLGYKQRLALACSLMHEPDILFLDEPTSGVDPLTRREFWLHINGMVDKGVTVMVTTHFMDEAEYCDRIGLVYHGKIIAAGTPDELKQQVTTTDNPDPSMEDAFIGLIMDYDKQQEAKWRIPLLIFRGVGLKHYAGKKVNKLLVTPAVPLSLYLFHWCYYLFLVTVSI